MLHAHMLKKKQKQLFQGSGRRNAVEEMKSFQQSAGVLCVLRAGAPSLRDLVPGDLRWSWCDNNRNKVHNKCSALGSSQTTPTPSSRNLKTLGVPLHWVRANGEVSEKRGFMPQNKLKGSSEAPCLPFSPTFPAFRPWKPGCSGAQVCWLRSPWGQAMLPSVPAPSPEGRGEGKGHRAHESDLYDLLAALVKGFGAKRLKLMTKVSFMY